MKKLISLPVFFTIMFGHNFWIYKEDPIGLYIDIPIIYATLSALFLWVFLVILSIFYKKIKVILNSFILSFAFITTSILSDLFIENYISKIFEKYCATKKFEDMVHSPKWLIEDCTENLNGIKFWILTFIIAILLTNLDKITRSKYLKNYFRKLES